MRTLEEIARGLGHRRQQGSAEDFCPACDDAWPCAVFLALEAAVAQAERTPEDAGCYICGKRNRGEHGHETFYLCPEHPNVHLRLLEQGAAQERAALLTLTDEDFGCCVSVNGKLFVNCNDFFAPAADGEEVGPEDEDALLIAHQADPKYGALRWVAQKRGIPFKHWHPSHETRLDAREKKA